MKPFRLALLLACLPLVGCAMGHEIVKVRTVKVAILPDYSLQVVSGKYRGLLAYLSEQTGYRLEPVLAMNYRSFPASLEGSGVEISFQNALLFTRLRKTKGAYPIAASLGSDGLLSGRGIIVVRKDSGINEPKDLEGKVVMIPAREAVLGCLAQSMLLFEDGINAQRDLSIVVGTRHDQVLRDVWRRRVDAGFVKRGVFSEAAGRVDVNELKTLAETKPFPNWCFAAFPESDPVVVDKITKALLRLNWEDPAQRAILETAGVKGFVDPSRLDLTPIYRGIQSLQLPY